MVAAQLRAQSAHHPHRRVLLLLAGPPRRRLPRELLLRHGPILVSKVRSLQQSQSGSVADLPAEATSFTYGDSITVLGLGEALGVPAPDPAHRGRVRGLGDLEDVVARHGMPQDARPGGADGYAGHQHRRVGHYVEVQLWSDEPLRAHLAST